MDDSNRQPRPIEMYFANLADWWILGILTAQAAAEAGRHAAADAAAPATTTSADTTTEADQAASQEITQ